MLRECQRECGHAFLPHALWEQQLTSICMFPSSLLLPHRDLKVERPTHSKSQHLFGSWFSLPSPCLNTSPDEGGVYGTRQPTCYGTSPSFL